MLFYQFIRSYTKMSINVNIIMKNKYCQIHLKHLIHSFIHSFSKELLSTYYEPSAVLDANDSWLE